MPEYVGDMSIRYVRRAEDTPDELQVNYSLLAQCEIDALRSEVQSLRYDLMLARGEAATLKDVVDDLSTFERFLGFPFRYIDESEEDCARLTYQVFYCGSWRDVNTCSMSFNRDKAIDAIIKMIKLEAAK